jgi:plasmid stabilization system protein ParE
MAKVIWVEDSLNDLKRINMFLGKKNPDAASRTLSSIALATRNLEDYPEFGKPYEGDIDYRELFVPFGARGYVIHYRINKDNVVILRVWHAREHR